MTSEFSGTLRSIASRHCVITAWLLAIGLSWPQLSAQESTETTVEKLTWEVQENRPEGSVIGSLRDAFPPSTTFELISDRSSDGFRIDSKTGEVFVTDSQSLNFEKSTVATLSVRAEQSLVEASDPYAAKFSSSLLEEGVSAEQLKELSRRAAVVRIQIQILDAPEAPELTEAEFTVKENSPAGTVVGTVKATDPDRRETLRFHIAEGNSDSVFVIDPASGVIRVGEGHLPDFEKAFLFDLKLSVTDNDDLVGFGRCTIRVTNEDESRPAPETRKVSEPAFVKGPDATSENPVKATDRPQTASAEPAPSKTPATTTNKAVAGTTPNNGIVQPWTGKKIIPPPPTDVPIPRDAVAATTDGHGAERTSTGSSSGNSAPVAEANGLTSGTSAGWKPELSLAANGHESNSLGLGQSGNAEAPGQNSDFASGTPGSANDSRFATPSKMKVTTPESGVQKAAWILAICVIPGLAAAGFVYWKQRRNAGVEEIPEEATEQSEASKDAVAETSATANESVDSPIAATVAEVLEEVAKSSSSKQASHAGSQFDDDGPFDPESLLSDEYFEPARGDSFPTPTGSSLAGSSVSSGYDDIEDSLRRNLSELRRDLAEYQSDFHADARPSHSSTFDVSAESTRFDGPTAPVPVGLLAAQTTDAWSGRSPQNADAESAESVIANDESLVAVMAENRTHVMPPIPTAIPELDSTETERPAGSADGGDTPSAASALRSELAELFELHSKSGVSQATPLNPKAMEPESDVPAIDSSSGDVDDEPQAATPSGTPSQLADEEHRNSVARYLDSLLQKKKGEETVTDRRKSNSPHSGPERRTNEPQKKAPKSFIESYLEQHGGKLPESDSGSASASSSASPSSLAKGGSASAAEEPAAPVLPQIPRTPVDVSSIREHMTSFREVATRSVEQALASYQMKQVKGRLALRTMLIIALVFVTGLIYAGNAAGVMQFPSLNYLAGLAILLALGELSLQMVTYWKTRREMTSAIRSDAERRPEEATETADSES